MCDVQVRPLVSTLHFTMPGTSINSFRHLLLEKKETKRAEDTMLFKRSEFNQVGNVMFTEDKTGSDLKKRRTGEGVGK